MIVQKTSVFPAGRDTVFQNLPQTVFKELGTPELTKIFCIKDECTYGDIPGLDFIRHTTLGTGGDKCDFYVRVTNI